MDFATKNYFEISYSYDCSYQELQQVKEIIGNSCKQIRKIINCDAAIDNCEIFNNVSLKLSYLNHINPSLIISMIENEAEGTKTKITQYSINADELIIELVNSIIICFIPATKDYILFQPGHICIVYNDSCFNYEPWEDKKGDEYAKEIMSKKGELNIKEIVNSFLDFITNHDFKTESSSSSFGMFD